MSSIATRKGDDGTTSLLYGQRVPKDHPQIEAVGAVDELNVALGAAKPLQRDPALSTLIETIQKNLVALMGELACAESDVVRYAGSSFDKIFPVDLARLDEAVVRLESSGLKLDGWATPGSNALSGAFEQARVVARRAERRMVSLSSHGRNLRPECLQFVNRLSDVLWLLARAAER
jgi:cob(I)alamin adenosyltransferase